MESLIFPRRAALSLAAAPALSFLLPSLSARAAARRGTERARSLIVLWMNGGMSQLETWDPHPGTASGGDVQDLATTVPDLRISSLLPQMAEQMHHCLTIRSVISKEGDHERGSAFVRSGYRPEPTLKYPTLGAVVVHQLGASGLEIPPYISITPRIPVPEGGYLGNAWNAFRIHHPGREVSNLTAPVPEARQTRRLENLQLLSRRFAAAHPAAASQTLHEDLTHKALQMMQSEQLRAFRLDDEPEPLRKAYGDNEFGRGCLVARRLVETGVRVVEVTLPGFDTHISNHEGHVTQCRMLDPAMSTLINDLHQRDLLQSTIVLCISEFGRTPAINAAAGRDHWPAWFSCVIAGGGFRRAAVIGATPAEIPSAEPPPPTDPVTVPEICATILEQLGVDSSLEVTTPVGRPIRFAEASPSARLLQ
ncbi:MAG: hypothetical protein RLZZ436_3116 [Planctomycetota bacterium]|jgi:hypothetical protein